MLGPIFNAEMLRAGRRGRARTLRWIYAGWLCLQLIYVFDATHAAVTHGMPPQPPVSRPKAAANFGQQFRDLILRQQFTLIVLITPAFVAGAITDEKTRGTLQGMLTAYVTPADIVLGKLAARIGQVGILALTPLPLLAFTGQYAGVTPEFLLALLAVSMLLLVGLGGLSMLASVWLRQTRSAVIATYSTLLAGYLLIHFGWLANAWWDHFGLLRVLDPLVNRDDSAEAFRRLGQAALAWGGLGVVTTTLAVWQLRPGYLRQLEARPRWRWPSRITARSLPVRDVIAWKECHVGQRVPLWVGLPLATSLATAVTSFYWIGVPTWRGSGPYILFQAGIYFFVLGTLIVGIRCSGSITGERERHTWDGLMMSPLTVREIVRGKHRGALRATWPYVPAAWFGATAIAGMTIHSDPMIQLGFVLFALGAGGLVLQFTPRALWWVSLVLILMMASISGLDVAIVVAIALGITWLAMYFLGAIGMFCSARSSSTWRSLLGTLALGYASGTVLWCVGLPIGCVGCLMLVGLVSVVTGDWIQSFGANGWFDIFYPFAMTAGSGLLFWAVARSFLTAAENTVAKRDRIPPDWVRMIEYDLPRHGPPRPRPRLRQ